MLEVPENLARIIRSQVEAWTAELVVLRRDPTVKKFLELQDKIDQTDAFMVGADAPFPSDWFRPYDLYDAFEFARNLSGRKVSTQALSRLAHTRFPDLSGMGREALTQFLIDNRWAEVARTTASERPASYRFHLPGNGGTEGKGSKLGLPRNELSGLKAEDLEDVVRLPMQEMEQS